MHVHVNKCNRGYSPLPLNLNRRGYGTEIEYQKSDEPVMQLTTLESCNPALTIIGRPVDQHLWERARLGRGPSYSTVKTGFAGSAGSRPAFIAMPEFSTRDNPCLSMGPQPLGRRTTWT